jgi:hypothetical protein
MEMGRGLVVEDQGRFLGIYIPFMAMWQEMETAFCYHSHSLAVVEPYFSWLLLDTLDIVSSSVGSDSGEQASRQGHVSSGMVNRSSVLHSRLDLH